MHNNILSYICIFICIATVSSKLIYRGVATNSWGGCEDLILLSNISWYYNWGLTPTSSIQGCSFGSRYIEYVPMVHAAADVTPDLVSKLPPGTKYLMSFNEPNFSSQGNLSPAQAATLWLQVEQQLSKAGLLGKIKLGAPSASPGGDLMSPHDWLTWFYGNCSTCHFDFQNFHIYDCNLPYYDAGALNYWLSIASSFGKPVWLTEFDCPNPSSAAMEIQWMQTALAALDSNPNVARYAWFTARSTDFYVGTIPSLLTNTIPTTLTPIGLFYNNAGDLLESPTQTTTTEGTTSTQSSSSSSSNTGTATSNTGTATSSNKGTSTSTASTNSGSKSSSSHATSSATNSATNAGSTSKSMTSGSTSKSTNTQKSSSSTQSSNSNTHSGTTSNSRTSSHSSDSNASLINSSSSLHHILIGAIAIVAFQILL
jgi:hypothetical protein